MRSFRRLKSRASLAAPGVLLLVGRPGSRGLGGAGANVCTMASTPLKELSACCCNRAGASSAHRRR
jgi:hypothetical protein